MFTSEQYRAKADQYSELARNAISHSEREEFQKLQRSFSVMADNEQWLADNDGNTVHATAAGRRLNDELAAEEEHVLRCLGAALIMQWNMLPTRLQHELFDNACSMGALADIRTLRAQIARFLHKHKNDKVETFATQGTQSAEQMQSQNASYTKTFFGDNIMNNINPKRSPDALANFSEAKKDILNDIRAKWGKFSEDDLSRLRSNDDLVNEIAARYRIDRARAQSDVDVIMRGRQI